MSATRTLQRVQQPASSVLRRYASTSSPSPSSSTSSSSFGGPSSSSYSTNDAPSYTSSIKNSPKPPLKTWYTGRPALSAFLQDLAERVKTTRETLYRSGVISSVDADVRQSTLASKVSSTSSSSTTTATSTTGVRWLPADAIGSKLGVENVRLAYYRRITSLLSELHQLAPLLSFAHDKAVYSQQELLEMLKSYTRVDARVEQASGVKKKSYGYTDEKTGIAYGLGRKKTASARAWVIPLQQQQQQQQQASSAKTSTETIGSIRINGLPLTTYFPDIAHRTVITRPLKLTETLGRYNIFILTSGGGYSSKSAAAAVAIARALASLGDVDTSSLPADSPVAKAATSSPLPTGVNRQILAKADLLRRDPRVVERKKTGRPKARKRFTWVKR